MNGHFYMILIIGKNISQYMQGSALHKHRTFYIAISPCMNTLDHGEILASSHHNINKLQVKLATSRDASLVRLPPSETALRQHILCAALQTKVWHAFCPVKSPKVYMIMLLRH
jgi:hypothetical protein